MKKIFNKDLKNILKTIIQFLTFIFLVVFISAAIMGKGEYNPLQMALYFTSFFGGFAFICIFIYTLFDYLTERHIQITKLSTTDFLNDQQFYREILNDYSPVLLAYIDKMRFDYDISIVSGLLSLKNKGYIETCTDKLNIIKYDFFNLNMTERYIIENIRNGKVENADQLKNIIFEEGKKKGLFTSNKKWLGIFPKGMRNLFIFSSIYFIIVELLVSFFNNEIILKDIIPITAFLVYIYVIFYAIKSKENLYSRSNKADELNQKLEGLKNYIIEYSLLEDKTSEDITLWEDYLIYSVIFNQNENIIKEYKKYY